MTGGIDPDSVHTGYFLPTAAGGLIGAGAAAQVHLHALAEASFGIGIISWILLGSTILNRLFTRPPPGATGYAIAVIVLLTTFVSWIAFRTMVLAVRGQLFPPWPPVQQAADTASLS